MYLSNNQPILVDESTRKHRTEIVDRFYGMGFNLIPMDGKKPSIKWKPYQTQRATPEEIEEWMRGRFPTKDGNSFWNAEILNVALITGAVPWSDDNPGVVVLDADDEQAEAILSQYCPETPMTQRTGGGGSHWVYRRPEVERISNCQKTVIGGESFNLDVRGDGGYIVAPGSIHPETGKMYEEVTPWTMELLMQCPVYDPTWLPCERATTKKTSISVPAEISGEHDDQIAEINTAVEVRETQARRYLTSVPGTQEGTGADEKCSALIMSLLWGFALPNKVVLNMLAEWGQKPDQLDVAGGWYPWTEQELASACQLNGQMSD